MFISLSGILDREQEQSVVYGSIDFGKTVVVDKKYQELLQKTAQVSRENASFYPALLSLFFCCFRCSFCHVVVLVAVVVVVVVFVVGFFYC